jgi:benzylsuccinate CoA-transferase BbsF subunit
MAGWPDRDPAGPFGAYTDYIAPKFNASAVLAALEHRRRTGEGRHIDLSQAEAALHFLAPALLDLCVNGHVPTRNGNRDDVFAPHGVYPTAGDDSWIAIAVERDAGWRALCECLGQPGLADDARFASAPSRVEHAHALDEIVAAFTAERVGAELEAELQARGVAAHRVLDSPGLVADPQLRARGHFVELESDGVHTTVEATRSQLSRTPASVAGGPPTLGRDNHTVLEELLGYDGERIVELVIAGVLD